MGADGGVGLNYNYVPRAFVRMWRNFAKRDIEAARRDQHEVNRIVRVLFQFGFHSVTKHIMKRKGFDCGAPRRPIRPLSDEEARQVDALIDPIGILWEDC